MLKIFLHGEWTKDRIETREVHFHIKEKKRKKSKVKEKKSWGMTERAEKSENYSNAQPGKALEFSRRNVKLSNVMGW